MGTKRKPSFANELGKNKSKNASILSQNATLIQKEKTPKGCTMCLNTCGLPKHTRRTCPKFTKFGVSAQLTTETLKCFEEKSPELLRLKTNFDTTSLLQAIPKEWQHVVIVDDFRVSCHPKSGNVRICEVFGLDEIGDSIDGPQCFVELASLRKRFDSNMSSPQAKKVMILALNSHLKAQSLDDRSSNSVSDKEMEDELGNIPETFLLI